VPREDLDTSKIVPRIDQDQPIDSKGNGSRALLVRPNDDAQEEERKMRANASIRGVADDDDEPLRKEKRVDHAAEVERMKPKGYDPTPTKDVDDRGKKVEDDDIEAKRHDDYDVGNYAEFEDDDDDVESLDPGERLV
jgi:hypothetical protein